MNQPGNIPDRYSSHHIAIHWLMLLLLAAIYLCAELHNFFPKGSAIRNGLMTWHFMLGLSVLALVALRLISRLTTPVPPITPEPPKWQQYIAKLLHLALYVLMIGMPLLGWLILSAAGKPIPFFGIELPALAGQNMGLAKTLRSIHEVAGRTGYFLIGVHALAALYHHYFIRDNTLKRMMPQHKKPQ